MITGNHYLQEKQEQMETSGCFSVVPVEHIYCVFVLCCLWESLSVGLNLIDGMTHEIIIRFVKNIHCQYFKRNLDVLQT